VRRAGRILRGMVRVAGRSRDLDVCARLFEKRLGARTGRSPEASLLLRRMKAARARSRSRLASGLLDLQISDLRRDLREMKARRCEEGFSVIRRLALEREKGGEEILGMIRALAGRYDPPELHRLRRRVRRMRYLSELASELGQEPRDAPKRLKDLQDILGLVHDAHLAAGWLEARAVYAVKAGKPAYAEEARRWRSIFEAAGRAHHREFLQAKAEETIVHALGIADSRGTAAS